jgi:hypothetical protein
MIHRLLARFGLMLVPIPPSSKLLHEYANVLETHHPSGVSRGTRWLRAVADRRG